MTTLRRVLQQSAREVSGGVGGGGGGGGAGDAALDGLLAAPPPPPPPASPKKVEKVGAGSAKEENATKTKGAKVATPSASSTASGGKRGWEAASATAKRRKSEASAGEASDAPPLTTPSPPPPPLPPVSAVASDAPQDSLPNGATAETTAEPNPALAQTQAQAHAPPPPPPESDSPMKRTLEWVQCEACKAWRKLPPHVRAASLPETWYCNMNTWDPWRASCAAPPDEDDTSYDPANAYTYGRSSSIPAFPAAAVGSSASANAASQNAASNATGAAANSSSTRVRLPDGINLYGGSHLASGQSSRTAGNYRELIVAHYRHFRSWSATDSDARFGASPQYTSSTLPRHHQHRSTASAFSTLFPSVSSALEAQRHRAAPPSRAAKPSLASKASSVGLDALGSSGS